MPTIAILSHAFEGTTSAGCEVCTLPFTHAAHTHGAEGSEVSVRCEAPTPRIPELCDAYGMLRSIEQHLAEIPPRTLPVEGYVRTTLRDAIALLRSELGPHAAPSAEGLQRYRERVAAQSARIDAALNEEGRKRRARRT